MRLAPSPTFLAAPQHVYVARKEITIVRTLHGRFTDGGLDYRAALTDATRGGTSSVLVEL